MTNATRPTPKFATSPGMLEFFHSRFDMSLATDSELQYLANSVNEITSMAASLAALVEGAGRLIDEDQVANGKSPRCGALQGEEQPALLYCIADRIQLIEQVSRIASDANWCLRARLIDRLKVERSRRGLSDEYSSQEVSNG